MSGKVYYTHNRTELEDGSPILQLLIAKAKMRCDEFLSEHPGKDNQITVVISFNGSRYVARCRVGTPHNKTTFAVVSHVES